MDQAAILLSGLCLLHCLALPVLIAGGSLLTQLGGAHLHLQMLAIVAPLSVLALAFGFRRHGSLRVLFCGAFGLALLAAGAIAHEHLGVVADRALTVTGSLVLAAVHYVNSRYARDTGTVFLFPFGSKRKEHAKEIGKLSP